MAVGMKSSALAPHLVRIPENKNHSYNVWDVWEALLRDVFPTVVVELWGWIIFRVSGMAASSAKLRVPAAVEFHRRRNITLKAR